MDLISILFSLLVGALGIYFTIKYSSIYHIRNKGKIREKYRITEIIEFRKKNETIDLYRMVLEKSSIKNAMGFVDFIKSDGEIKAKHYAFINSCIHNILAPGKIIFDDNKTIYTEKAPSNEFTSYTIKTQRFRNASDKLIPKRYRKYSPKCFYTESEFDYPKTYTGPRYDKRIITFCPGIGILRSETIYKSGQKDTYILKNHKIKDKTEMAFPINNIGNYWVYDIEYSVGPNKININE
ncbi:MAG: hypothetical protein MUP85_13830 [Candidatus Lokiarchaeota archaeon]|nr:hypothetical protein [Candidatus Lokiarchaeota archaeon]